MGAFVEYKINAMLLFVLDVQIVHSI